MGVAFLDDLDDVVSGSAKSDMVGHPPGHAGMQEGDQLAFCVEDSCARVTMAREVAMLLVEVEDGDLPGIALEFITGIRLQPGEATKGKIGRLSILGHDEARVALVVPEVGIRQTCGVDATQKSKEVIFRVLKGW